MIDLLNIFLIKLAEKSYQYTSVSDILFFSLLEKTEAEMRKVEIFLNETFL